LYSRPDSAVYCWRDGQVITSEIPSHPISRSALHHTSRSIEIHQSGMGPREIDGDTIRDTIDQIIHSCHSTQVCHSHPRSSRKCTPSTIVTAPKMTGMRSLWSWVSLGQVWMTRRTMSVPVVSQEPKAAASLGLHFAKTNTAAEALNMARFTGLCASFVSFARFAQWALALLTTTSNRLCK